MFDVSISISIERLFIPLMRSIVLSLNGYVDFSDNSFFVVDLKFKWQRLRFLYFTLFRSIEERIAIQCTNTCFSRGISRNSVDNYWHEVLIICE